MQRPSPGPRTPPCGLASVFAPKASPITPRAWRRVTRTTASSVPSDEMLCPGPGPSRPGFMLSITKRPEPQVRTDLVVVGQLPPGPHLLHHQVPEVTLRLEVSLKDFFLGCCFDF